MGPGLRFTVETHKQESVALCHQMWQTLSWSYNGRATLDLLYVHWHKNRTRIRCLQLFKGFSWKLRHGCAVWTTDAMSSWFFSQFDLLNIVPVFQWWGFIAFLCTISQINMFGFWTLCLGEVSRNHSEKILLNCKNSAFPRLKSWIR